MRSSGTAKWCSGVSLLPAMPACADGGISALGGLLDMLLLFIGMLGLILVVPLMVSAIGTRRATGRGSTKCAIALTLACLYVLGTSPFYFLAQESEFAKFPALLAIAVIALVCVYHWHSRRGLLLLVLTPLTAGAAAMLATPADFWRGNAFDLVETIYIDNSGDLKKSVLGDPREKGPQLLLLTDGRQILQFAPFDAGPVELFFTDERGKLVSLRPINAEPAGQWFDVIHYKENYSYVRERQNSRRPPRHSLFTTTVNMYVPNGSQAFGVLLDQRAEIDHRALLLKILGWSDWHLQKELIRLGSIDVNEQPFIDAAFQSRSRGTYRFLADLRVSAKATASNGQTLLHRAAAVGDVGLMQILVRRGASMTTPDNDGFTPPQLFWARNAKQPGPAQMFNKAFPQWARR